MSMNKNIKKSIMDMLNDEKFIIVVKNSIPKLIPSFFRSIVLIIFFILVFCLFYFNEQISDDLFTVLHNINENLTGILISVFGVVLTGYAIFQALTSGSTLVDLMTVIEKDKSKYKHYNMSFFITTIMYLTLIIVNFLLNIFFSLFNGEWEFPYFSSTLNTNIVILFYSLYLTLVFNALIELKSFIYNLYQCFTINAASKGIEHLSKDAKKFDP